MFHEFRTRLLRNERLLGTMVTCPSSAVAEILATCGFDWLFIDAEHGPLETSDVQSVLQTVGDRIACIVRVPSAEEVPIKKVLDLGAAGIIAPQVNTVEQAERVVQFARYAPEGSRGVGLARAHGYGLSFASYLATANKHVTVVVQAEHVDAVRNIEAIVKVDGIDAVLIGPYDLAASLGSMGKIDEPAVTDAIEHITRTCQKAHLPLGIFGLTAEAVQPYIERGYTLIVAGVDTLFLGQAAMSLVSKLRSIEE